MSTINWIKAGINVNFDKLVHTCAVGGNSILLFIQNLPPHSSHTHRCILSKQSNKNICHYREAFMKIELPVGGSFKLPSPLFWKLFSPPLRTTRFFWFILRLFSWKLSRVRLSCNSAGVLPFNGCRNTWDIWDIWSNCFLRDMCHFISICVMLCHFMLYFISFCIFCHFFQFGGISLSVPFCVICQFWAPWKFSLSFAYMRISFA